MKRKLLTIVMTLLVLTGLSFGVPYFTQSNFIDCSCFIGIGATITIWFFTSKNDGYVTRRLDLSIQGSTGIRMEDKRFEFSSNIAFLTSVAYTIITIAAILYHYRSYF
ncbi:hypothetical protein [Psychrobacillus sp. BM2]|uniref:hypothetical protein n=1 Tax=Psychrobacillus sp. BM2 TaxID=3400421 RepID=UPI003B01C973